MSLYTFPAKVRLTHDRQFQAVHAARMRKNVGPLAVMSLPNGLAHWRLGLAVSRKCGNAVERNRIKRCLRESFRLLQHELPRLADGTGLDIVIAPRPHEPMEQAAYQAAMAGVAVQLVASWNERIGKRREKES